MFSEREIFVGVRDQNHQPCVWCFGLVISMKRFAIKWDFLMTQNSDRVG